MLALLLVLTACTVPDGSVAVDDAAPTPPRPDQAPGGLTASLVPPTTTTPGTLDPFCWASAPVQPPACAVVDPTLADCTATTEILRDGVPFLTDTRQFDPCGREWCSWQTLPDGSLHRAEERTWTAEGLLLEIARDGGMLPATGQPSQLVLHAYDADDRPLSVTGNAFGAGDITWGTRTTTPGGTRATACSCRTPAPGTPCWAFPSRSEPPPGPPTETTATASRPSPTTHSAGSCWPRPSS